MQCNEVCRRAGCINGVFSRVYRVDRVDGKESKVKAELQLEFERFCVLCRDICEHVCVLEGSSKNLLFIKIKCGHLKCAETFAT